MGGAASSMQSSTPAIHSFTPGAPMQPMDDCLEDFLAGMDDFADDCLEDFLADMDEDPTTQPSTVVPRAESATWQFVNEEPGSDLHALPRKPPLYTIKQTAHRPPSENLNRTKACTHCRASKVKCLRNPGMNACDRCAFKGLLCEQPKVDQKPNKPTRVKRARQIKAVHRSNRTAQPGAPLCDKSSPGVRDSCNSLLTIPEPSLITNQGAKLPEPSLITNQGAKRSRLGTVMDAMCSVASNSAATVTASFDKLHGALHDKFKFGLDRYNGAIWMAAFLALRRRVVKEEQKKNAYCLLHLESNVTSAYRTYFTQLQGYAEDILCKRAQDALESICLQKQMSLEQFQHSPWWIPAHIPQLNGPDPVWVASMVLGVRSKRSNFAWDRLFRNSTELEDFLASSVDALKSPLCKVGLFPLIGIFNSVEDEQKVADQYFWHCGTTWKGKMCSIPKLDHNSEMEHYHSHVEFSASCRDKHGNDLECGFRIACCAQTSGALMSRTIRAIPKPPALNRLRMEEAQAAQQQSKVQCAQVTFTK